MDALHPLDFGRSRLTRRAPGHKPRELPLDRDRLKREARRLADWTGLPLSRAQELTARAYGATSWQALARQDTFVPDEELGLLGSERSDAGTAALCKALCIAQPLARLLLDTWQPAAEKPTYRLAANLYPDAPFWRLSEVLGGHEDLPAGAVLALAHPAGRRQPPQLVVVAGGRQAAIVDDADVVVPAPEQFAGRHARGHMRLQSTGPGERKPVWVRGQLEHVRLTREQQQQLQAERPAAVLKAAWLREPLPPLLLMERFASHFAWDPSAYARVHELQDVFFSLTLKGTRFVANQEAGAVYISVLQPGEQDVDAGRPLGSAGVERLKPHGQPEGYYLVKYGDQASGRPLPNFTSQDADAVCQIFGLNNRAGRPAFYGSTAGLAFASWLAARPEQSLKRAHEAPVDPYIFDWFDKALGRMQFELARHGKL